MHAHTQGGDGDANWLMVPGSALLTDTPVDLFSRTPLEVHLEGHFHILRRELLGQDQLLSVSIPPLGSK